MKRRTMTYVARIAVSGVIVATMANCSASDDRDDIAIVAEDSGWTGSGGSVDAGVICPGGVPNHIGFLELDGSPLAPDEGFERLVDGLWDDPLDEVADFLALHQLTCADGSGSFTLVAEGRNGGPWSVREGTGAYAQLSGSGTLEIERQPSEEPDTPPGGFPIAQTFTGTIEIAD